MHCSESPTSSRPTHRTAGGEEDCWAYVLPSGQRVLIYLRGPYHQVRLISDPPKLGPYSRRWGSRPMTRGRIAIANRTRRNKNDELSHASSITVYEGYSGLRTGCARAS